jgi:hypothetical protein
MSKIIANILYAASSRQIDLGGVACLIDQSDFLQVPTVRNLPPKPGRIAETQQPSCTTARTVMIENRFPVFHWMVVGACRLAALESPNGCTQLVHRNRSQVDR